ncbi:MAG: DNA replication/repair protein RecF, partial [Oscillospiraceae bacterium]
KIKCQFKNDKTNTLEITYDNKKNIIFNDIKKASFSNIENNLLSVVFSPIDLNIIKDGPDVRRKFLDNAIIQIKPSYSNILKDYKNIINQKNNLLKNFLNNDYMLDLIDIYNKQLCKIGTFIHCTRQNFLKELNKYSKEYYQKISCNNETFNLDYISDIFSNEDFDNIQYNNHFIDFYYKVLTKSISEDIKFKISSKGIHRDDFNVKIKNLDAKKFASQGQQRSAVLVLKLAQCDIYKEISGFNPIVLLDDIMSELDSFRVNFVLNNILDKQVIITSCDDSIFKNLDFNYSIFNIENGYLK